MLRNSKCYKEKKIRRKELKENIYSNKVTCASSIEFQWLKLRILKSLIRFSISNTIERCHLKPSLTVQFIKLNLIHQRITLTPEKIFDNWKPFKNDEKRFLFHLKSSFRSPDIKVSVLNFRSCRKTAWLERSG